MIEGYVFKDVLSGIPAPAKKQDDPGAHYRFEYIGNDLKKLSHTLSHNAKSNFELNTAFCNSLIQLVGTTGFEPATPCPPDK